MSVNRLNTVIMRVLLAAFLLLPCTAIVRGQAKQLLTWKENLSYLQNMPDSDLERQADDVKQIRTGMEFWLQLHPESNIQLPDESPQLRSEIAALQKTVADLLKQSSVRPFDLGVTEISVTEELSPLSPVADSFSSDDIENHHATRMTQTFKYLPGVAVDYKPSRNQAGIMIRGFDTRQVGFYLDNIPIYVPYDGYADMGRFLTSEVAEIQVAKGYSSPLLGPNGLGGAVNIVTRQPEKKLEGVLTMGTGSGEMVESGIHMGSRMGKFILQGGMDWLQTNYYPVPGDFVANEIQPNYKRTNSFERDSDYDGRVGFIPNDRDSYVFSFMGQKAEYGAPPYSGENENPKFWRWPYWDRESYYFNGRKGLGEKNDIQFRLFYDKYPNMLNDYSDSSYSTVVTSSSYDDYSAGLSSEFTTRALNRHTIGISFFFKDDTHRESDIDFTGEEPVNIPSRTHRDQQFSFGAQDSINLTSRIRATLGFSAEHIDGIKAQDLASRRGEYFILPFECAGEEGAESFAACLNEWAFNPLASISFSISQSGTFFATFAKKSHFPTMKDRYSYKNNKALPNPTLESEHTRNWSIGYSHVLPHKTMVQVDLFRSDVYDAVARSLIPVEDENICSRTSGAFCEQSINVGKELHQGVEFIIRSNAISNVTLDMNYSYLSRSITGPEEMSAVFPTGTPKHKLVGTGNVTLPADIFLTATVRYENGNIGDFFVDDENYIIPIPASNFTTVDLAGNIPIVGGARVQVGVKNMFDEYYYYREGYPRAGRNWFLNMKIRF